MRLDKLFTRNSILALFLSASSVSAAPVYYTFETDYGTSVTPFGSNYGYAPSLVNDRRYDDERYLSDVIYELSQQAGVDTTAQFIFRTESGIEPFDNEVDLSKPFSYDFEFIGGYAYGKELVIRNEIEGRAARNYGGWDEPELNTVNIIDDDIFIGSQYIGDSDVLGSPSRHWDLEYSGEVNAFGFDVEFDFITSWLTDISYNNPLDGDSIEVPEPATIALMGLGLVGIFGMRRRKNR